LTSELTNRREKVWVLRPSSARDAKNIIEYALKQRRLIQILGRCNVEYQGRARSVLTEGERLIVLKKDGTLLVHQPEGVEPVNWQPPGAAVKVTLEGEKLVLHINRPKPRETVRITFTDLFLVSASDIHDTGEFSMYLTEEEMQQVLTAHPELIEPGLRAIRRERPVPPGFIDIYAKDAEGRIVVIEIKRRKADREAVLQLHKYIKSFHRDQQHMPVIRGILVAPGLVRGVKVLLERLGLEYRRVRPEDCYRLMRQPMSRRITEFCTGES